MSRMERKTEHLGRNAFPGLGLVLLLAPARAWGYIDPGSGSYLLQVLLAFFFGSLFVMKNFWKKTVRKIARLFRRDDHDARRNADP